MFARCSQSSSTIIAALLISWLPLALAPAPAQSPSPSQTITTESSTRPRLRFINATGLSGNLIYHLNDQPLNPVGFPSGHVSGALTCEPQTFVFKVEHPQHGTATTKLIISPESQFIVIIYAERKKQLKADPPSDLKLKFHLLTPSSNTPEASPPSLTLLQITDKKELSLSVNKREFTLKRLVPQRMENGVGSELKISSPTIPLTTLDIQPTKHGGLLLYQDAAGNLQYLYSAW